jgi:flagellar motor switch protein FliN
MSPEQENPAGGQGDISEDELRRILGDDYDAVVGKDKEPETPEAEAAPVEAAVSTEAPQTSGEAAPNMTPEEADAWARSMASQLEDTPVGEPARPAPRPAPAPAPPAPPAMEPATVAPVQFGQLEENAGRQGASMDVLLDVKLPISVELGRTEMQVKEILDCGPGTVIELDKLAGEPVDVFINGRMVAQGEVVVVDEHFGVRVTSLLSPRDRVRSLA